MSIRVEMCMGMGFPREGVGINFGSGAGMGIHGNGIGNGSELMGMGGNEWERRKPFPHISTSEGVRVHREESV